jgi:hypothetical protein
MRAYWLAAACLSVVLVVRAATATPAPVTLILGVVATTILLLGVRVVTQTTGRVTARLIARST